MRRRTCCILALTAGLLAVPAGEEMTPDQLKSAVRTLHSSLLRKNKVWTCLQLEAYAREELKLRLSGVLGSSRIYGSARFAFPHDIRNVWDRGDTVDVMAGDSFYRLASDGRPLQASLPMPIWPGSNWLTWDGRYLAIANDYGPYNTRRFRAAIVDAASGETLHQDDVAMPTAPEGIWDRVHWRPVCADDGSAFAVVLNRDGDQPACKRLKILVKDQEVRTINGVWSIRAVGARGGWYIYEKFPERGPLYLRLDGKDQRIYSMARGPGLICIELEQDKTLQLLTTEGKLLPFDPAVSLGGSAEVNTVGKYLVVRSGHGAQTKPTTDILGNPIGGGEPQPYTLCLYRWDDLAKDPQSPPVLSLPSGFTYAHHHAPGLLLREGAKLIHLDLTGEKPTRHLVAELPWEIADVRSSHHYYRLRGDDDEYLVLRADGVELWRGRGYRPDVNTRLHLRLRVEEGEGSPLQIIHLAPEQERRKVITLGLKYTNDPRWHINCDPRNRFIVGWSGYNWKTFNVDTGKVDESYTHNPMGETRRGPRARRERNDDGRWFAAGGRLLAKAGGWEDVVPQRLRPAAVYRGSVGIILIDQSNKLYHGRKPDDLKEIGTADVNNFGIIKGVNGFFLTRVWRRNREVIAELTRGMKLKLDSKAIGQQAQDLPRGRWSESFRNDAWRFIPGGRGRQAWDRKLAGFSPRSCRSYPNTQLFVLTESLVIELDVNAVKRLAKKDS